MKTLFLSPPSFDGFDGGAGSRYQARREVTSFWYPTWLAQPAALVPNAKLLDCPPHDIDIQRCLEEAKGCALPGYSVLVGPLAWVFGLRVVGALSVLASVACFEALAVAAY